MSRYARLRQAFIIAVLVVLAFIIPELVARRFMPAWAPNEYVFFVPDRESGWRHPPSTQLFYRDAIFTTNHLGLRDADPGIKSRPRILFLGDSFTWGWGINNEERYTDILQGMLPEYQLLNAGITGYGTLQQLYLFQALEEELKPDLIVLQMYNNDFDDNVEINGVYPHPWLDWQQDFVIRNHPVPADPWYRGLLNYITGETWFYRQLAAHLFSYLLKLPVDWVKHPPEADEISKQQAMRLSLAMLDEACKKSNIPLIIFTHDLTQERQSVIAEVSSAQGIEMYSLDTDLAAGTERIDLGDPHAHWNAYGNKLVAKAMYPVLRHRM